MNRVRPYGPYADNELRRLGELVATLNHEFRYKCKFKEPGWWDIRIQLDRARFDYMTRRERLRKRWRMEHGRMATD